MDAKGWRMPSSYLGYYMKYQPGWFSYRTPTATVKNSVLGPYLSSTIISASFPSSWADSAQQRALLKLKHRNLNLAVSLGEIRQTYSMLRETVDRVAHLAKVLRGKFTLRRWRQIHPQDWGDLWLEYRYGWRPLLSDLFGVASALDARISGEYDKTSLTTRARNQVPLGSTAFHQRVSTTGGLTYDVYIDTGGIYTARCRMDALVLNGDYRRLVDTGVNDPLLVAWELLPYSFCIDWFIGVGKFLDGLTAMWGLAYRGGSVTKHYIQVKEVRIANARGFSSFSVLQPEYTSLNRFDRSVIAAPSSKLVWYGLDRFLQDKNLWFDALQLLRQRLLR